MSDNFGTETPELSEVDRELYAAAQARLDAINMELRMYDDMHHHGHCVRDDRFQQLLTEHDQIVNHLMAEKPCDGHDCYVCDADAAWGVDRYETI